MSGASNSQIHAIAKQRRRRPVHQGEVPLDTATPPSACCCTCGPSTDDKIQAEIERLANEADLRPHGSQAYRRREPHLLDRNSGPHPVYLNVYHLVEGQSNRKLHSAGVGVFHSGVQIHGEEWSFGAPATPEELTGVFTVQPMEAVGELHAHVYLGSTTISREQLRTINRRVCVEWPAIEYDVLNKNCNHFCEEFCRLISTHMPLHVPKWINRASRWSGTVIPRFAAMAAIKLVANEEPPKCKAPDYTCNTGSDVRDAARRECRVDRVAMHYQVTAVMATTVTPIKGTRPTAAVTPGGSASAAAAGGSSGGRPSATLPPRPGSSQPPPRPGTTAVTFRSPSHFDPTSPSNAGAIGAIASPTASTPPAAAASRRAEPRVTFMEQPGAGNLAEALAISASADLGDGSQQQQSLGVRRGSGISPLLAPPSGELSPAASGAAGTSPQVERVSPSASALPTTHQHSRGPSELGASENGMGLDDDGTVDLDSTHRTASPHPQHSAAASSMRTMQPDDDDQTFTFTQTVDHHTLAAGAVTIDQAELSLEQRMPTAAQELTAGSQGGAFGEGTATLLADPDATATAGITENNAFLHTSRGPDASTMSAALESGRALRHRMDTDGGGSEGGGANGGGRGDHGDATFSDPDGADSTDQSPLAPVHHTRVTSDPLDMSNSAGVAPRGGTSGNGLPPPLVGMDAIDVTMQPTPDSNGSPAAGQRRRRSSASPQDASIATGPAGVSRTLSLRDIRLPIDDPTVAASASRVTTPAPAGGSAEKDHVASGERGSRGGDDDDDESTPSRSPCSVNLADI